MSESIGCIIVDKECLTLLHKTYLPQEVEIHAATLNALGKKYKGCMVMAPGAPCWDLFAGETVGHRITEQERDAAYEAAHKAQVDRLWEMMSKDHIPPDEREQAYANLYNNLIAPGSFLERIRHGE